MHPEILRQLTEQRNLEAQTRAQRDRLAKQLLRSLRHHSSAADSNVYAIPAIPDYIDGSFIDSAQQAKSAAAPGAHRVPAARDAA
jgi:hypothetical protein